VTKGKWEVTYYGFDEKQILFLSVYGEWINQRAIYRIALNGKSKLALSDEIGTNDATFSPNYQYYINTFSSSAQATTYSLNEAKREHK
jgi:dipeptidyl-peptidase-4